MRSKFFLTLAAFALLLAGTPARTQQQQQDQKVIDDFITTRGVSFEPEKKSQPTPTSATSPSPARRSGASSAPPKKSSAGGQAASKKSNTSAGKSAVASKGADGPNIVGDDETNANASANGAQFINASLRPIGLGYTVFVKEQSGGLLPVDPSREYKSGERIAIALEPNTDGYIYIFNAENDREVAMLFPNADIDGGANDARSHVRETYPTDVNYAFEFDSTPAIEHLYVIVSRTPLEGVPTGAALAELCKKNCGEYGWKPSPELWAKIKSGAAGGGRVIEAKNAPLLAQAKSQPVPSSSLQRGIKIMKDEPAPAIVRVNDSAETNTLVTVIKLVHK